jgi:PKD repeat protein
VASFTWTVSGYTVNVASTSTDDHGIVSSSWSWGDGSPAGTGAIASHTYTNVPPLLKTITLTVTDTVGQTSSVSNDVTLQDNAPVAAFTWTADLLVVSVDGSTSSDDHGIVSWSWNWGDGSPAGSGMTATHTYGAAGTYTITLTVTDTIGQIDSMAMPVDVVGGGDAPPVASFTGVTASGGMLTLDGSSSTDDIGIVSWDWNFGDHIIASGVNRVHKYVATGTYTVTLTVTDTIGQTASLSKTFSVTNTALPPLPYTVYGFTYASDGVTLLADITVTVTNVRTGETLIDTPLTDASGLYYVNDVMPLYFLTGDTMVVNAMGPGGLTGSTSVVLDLTGQPYLQVDLTLV